MRTHDSTPGRLALRVFEEALAASDAGRAVERAVRLDDNRLHIFDDQFDLAPGARPVYSVALGKAAAPMAAALDRLLGARLTGGVLSSPPLSDEQAAQLSARRLVFEGGHPLPNEASLAAARASFDLLRRADEESALVIFLVSGGGSAMIEWPRDPSLTLDDLREANRALVSCGAPIAEVNAVRRALSAVKGGRLARRAPRAAQVTLIVSDTRAGEEQTVASGPTLAPPTDQAHDAREIIRRYGLDTRLPARVVAAVERAAGEEAAAGAAGVAAAPDGRPAPVRRHHVLLDSASCVGRAAEVARGLGCAVEVAGDISDQHVAEGARLLVARLLELRGRAPRDKPVCLVSGGEFSCPVRGGGAGGRSSETALRCALELEARGLAANADAPRLALLLAGTDGRDGNSPAAGALCDETTPARARALGLDPQKFLHESDSYNFFRALGDALTTGHTGTNVRDLRVLVAVGGEQ